jgi:hypothetical protein
MEGQMFSFFQNTRAIDKNLIQNSPKTSRRPHRVSIMSLSNKLSITDVEKDLKDKRVLIRVTSTPPSPQKQ